MYTYPECTCNSSRKNRSQEINQHILPSGQANQVNFIGAITMAQDETQVQESTPLQWFEHQIINKVYTRCFEFQDLIGDRSQTTQRISIKQVAYGKWVFVLRVKAS